MSSDEARFAGDMRWVWREFYEPDIINPVRRRVLQVGVPCRAGPSVWFEWEDVPEREE